MGELRTLPVSPDARPVEHRTLSVDALAQLLAQAEELGYRRALLDANVDQREAHRLRASHEVLYPVRVDLYASIWRRAGKGL